MTTDYATEEFATTDLGLACALVTLGYAIERLDRDNPSRVQFVFRSQDGLQEDADNYWNDQLEVNPQSYFNNSKRIKNQIYSGLGNVDR